MPISPIVLQRRHAEQGRIRLGAKRNGNGAPMKLEMFRFTSPSQSHIADLAALYGGEARAWDNGGKPEFEVYTEAKDIPVIAVKGGLSQWLETWSGGGCTHRCDGETNVLTDEPCNPNDPSHKNAKPTTRLSLMLPELDSLGVWRMESHGWNAAAEIPAVAELAQFVGDMVPARLHLVERRAVKNGQTSRFVVPVLDLQIGTARLRELVSQMSGGAAELQAPAAGGRPALAAPATAEPDPFAPYTVRVNAAEDLDELAAVWDDARAANLVGPNAANTPAAQTFVGHFKVRAQAVKPPAAPSETPAAVPDAEGIVDAEVVPDADGQPTLDGGTAAEPNDDADAVWQRIVAAAGGQGMSLPDVQDDFTQRMGGVTADTASTGELQAYLQILETGAAA